MYKRARTPNPEILKTDALPGERSVTKTTKRPLTTSKSKIPKQGSKGSNLPSVSSGIQDGHDGANSEKLKSSRPSSPKSGEKTGSVLSKQKVAAISIHVNNFNANLKRYIALKMDINDKQKNSIAQYRDLQQARNKLINMGGKDPGKLEDLAPLPTLSGYGDKPGDGSEIFLVQFEEEIKAIPSAMAEYANISHEKCTKFATWLGEVQGDAPIDEDFRIVLKQQLEEYNVESTKFKENLESVKQEQLQNAENLLKRVTDLWHESKANQQVILESQNNEEQKESGEEKPSLFKLQAEREKVAKARVKVHELEKSVQSMEQKINTSNNTIQQLTSQLKLQEQTIEQKNKELSKFHKHNESTMGRLERHKETEGTKVARYIDQIQEKERELEDVHQGYKIKLKELEEELETERKAKAEIEARFEEFSARSAKLEDKCKELLDIQEKSKDLASDDRHTEYEIQLFNDLQEYKRLLVEKEETIKKLEQEREAIIIEDNENISAKQKITIELVKKYKEVDEITNNFSQLQKNYQRVQQKLEHLENKLADMNRMHNQVKGGSKTQYATHIFQLQQQVTDLRSSLVESERAKQELEMTCTHLQLKLEHYKRYMLNQDKDMKVRREMQMLLQYKDIDAVMGREDDKGNITSVGEEFQQLYASLEQKELQVMKLEKLVKQMEKQEEYSQGQRTRLENRIAQLEVANKEGQQANRNRGFSFL